MFKVFRVDIFKVVKMYEKQADGKEDKFVNVVGACYAKFGSEYNKPHQTMTISAITSDLEENCKVRDEG